jgi:hypothetical protein
MLVTLQLVGVAAVPLKVIVLVPCVAPKFVPVTVTEVPTAPELGLRLVMSGDVMVVDVPGALPHPKRQTAKAAESSSNCSESRRQFVQLHPPRGAVLKPRFVNRQPIDVLRLLNQGIPMLTPQADLTVPLTTCPDSEPPSPVGRWKAQTTPLSPVSLTERPRLGAVSRALLLTSRFTGRRPHQEGKKLIDISLQTGAGRELIAKKWSSLASTPLNYHTRPSIDVPRG